MDLAQKQKAYDEWKATRDMERKSQNLSIETPAPQTTPEHTYKSEEHRRMAEENRRKYPELAAFVDEIRKHFPGARVVKITPRQEAQATREPDEWDEPTSQI